MMLDMHNSDHDPGELVDLPGIPGDAPYQQLARSMSDFLNATDLDVESLAQIMRWLVQTSPLADGCSQCRKEHHVLDSIVWPMVRNADTGRYGYRCERGHVWGCWFAPSVSNRAGF